MVKNFRTQNWYNELYSDEGVVRPHYQAVHSHWQTISPSQTKKLFKDSRRLFSDDYSVDPLPRLITHSEFQLIRSGVEQRAKAIRNFLVDYYSRGRKWKRVLPPQVLKTTVERNHRRQLVGRLKHESIAFPYGPDVVRDRNGKWRVIEDSAGYGTHFLA